MSHEARRKQKSKKKVNVGLIEKLTDDVDSFKREITRRFNSLVDRANQLQENFQQIVSATGHQLATLRANQEVHMDAIEQLDIYNQANARAILECYGRFEQISLFLEKLGHKPEDLTAEEIDTVKKAAKEAYETTMASCFQVVREEREAKLKEIQEQRKKEKEEQAKAQSEQQSAEEEIRSAEERKLVDEPGGEGADIPEGAEVFGD